MENQTVQQAAEPKSNNSKSILSMMIGVFSVLFSLFIGLYTLLLAVPGLIIGMLALKEINELNELGKGRAIAGIVTNTFAIGLQIIMVIFIVLVIA